MPFGPPFGCGGREIIRPDCLLSNRRFWSAVDPSDRRPLLGVKQTSAGHGPMSAYDPKRTLLALSKSGELGRYSPLVRRRETDRIMGAASTTTGSIAAHDATQDNSQWVRNWLIVTNGKLAIPAAIRHVNPA